jgi:hypothetical protein
VQVTYINKKTEYKVNLDAAWVWVRLEDDLNLTITQAQEKMADGSTKIITYAIWLASESETPYNIWVKDLEDFDIVGDDDPKDIPSEV